METPPANRNATKTQGLETCPRQMPFQPSSIPLQPGCRRCYFTPSQGNRSAPGSRCSPQYAALHTQERSPYVAKRIPQGPRLTWEKRSQGKLRH